MRWLGLVIATSVALYGAPAMAQEPETPVPDEEFPEPTPPSPATVTIEAKDDAGGVVRGATLFVDDKPIAYELDGKLIELAPGPHTVLLQKNDGSRARISETLTINAGEAGRVVHFTFPKDVAPAPPLLASTKTPVLPRIVVGAGLAAVVTGTVFILVRPTIPGNCDADKGTCTKLSAETEAQAANDRDRAGRYRGLTDAAIITIVSGGVVAAGGLLWYVLAKPPPPQTAIAPWAAPSSAGLVLRRSF